MRYDLLPAEYCEELSRLLDRLPPSPRIDIVQRVELDLGKKIDECFLTVAGDDGKLGQWRSAALSGQNPEFGANLRY